MSQERIEREKELEMLAVQMRDERIELDVERSGLSGTAGGKSLIKRTLSETEGSCVEALTEWKQAEEAKRRRSNAYKYLALLDNETLTYITARSLINALAKKSPAYRQTIDNLADEVMAAGAAHLYKMKDTDAFKSLTRRLNWQEKLYVRKRIANEEFRNECIELTPTIQEKLAVGATLCEIFCRTTGLFEVKTIWVRKQESRKELAITPMGQKWVQDAFNTNRMANPLHLPMVIKPYPWTTLYDGGYLYQNLHPATLVRTKSGSIHPSIKEADLTQVMDAVNAIQETAWQINKPVLDVWRQLVGTGLAGCSDGESMPIPEALDKEDPEYAERQTARRECFEYNKDNTAKRCVEIQKLRMAEILENEAEIYFPHNLDFRGRIYPLAGRGAINPQGDDSGKALLRFASGKRLGAEGVPWLFIHTQNTLGNDKVSLQRRVSATEENIGLYISYALDPLNNVGWMEADKPFCFLACCFELLGYSIEGEDYVSHLPIAIDGSCSGLQHFAGIMKDRGTAEAVNVVQVDDEKSADIYTKVAEGVHAHLVRRIQNCHKAGQEVEDLDSYWVDKVTRDLVKQPVMTLSYGVTATGMRNQIVDKCKKLVRKGKAEYAQGADREYAAYLADCIMQVIGDVARAAFDVMDWLGAAAKIKAQTVEGLDAALSWTTPVGLPVVQEYYDSDRTRLHVFVEGREVKFMQRTQPVQVKTVKQKQGAAPNFVHSMDASHLMLTVECCAEVYGIESFAMIHDSFGTHAADTGVLFEVTRQEFAKMYEVDWLLELYDALPDEVKEKLPPPPARGDLDLGLVMDSEFFFA